MQRLWIIPICAIVITVGLIGTGGMTSDAAAGQRPAASNDLAVEPAATGDAKASFTAAQNKIGANYVLEIKRRRGEAVPGAGPFANVADDGTVHVKVKGTVTDGLVDAIASLGGTIIASWPQYGAIDAEIPIMALEAIAERGEVGSIRPPDVAITNQQNVSEGDVAHRADLARTTFGVDGTGTKSCVISSGIDELPGVQATGDLPLDISVLPGQEGAGRAGGAMLEIIHDLAPGADLGFATALPSQEQFATNILDLANSSCDVIVDDVLFIAEPVFQDGIIAQAASDVVQNQGVAYFSAAGNGGNARNGTSSVYEGDYVDSGFDTSDLPGFFPGLPDPGISGSLALLNGQPSVVAQPTSGTRPAVLQWADPIGGSTNDFDLCLIRPSGPSIFCSTDPQDGTQDPIEIIGDEVGEPVVEPGDHLVVVNWGDQADLRYLNLNTFGVPLDVGKPGSIGGHTGADDVITVGAADVAQAGGGTFDGTEAIEDFSSDGPRRVFFDADGNPFTPGNFSSTGGVVRQKPDISAADGVSTVTPGFETFFGTSAAAPHAAAIAGLMMQADPTLTPAEIEALLESTAIDIEDTGFDNDSGFGLIDAFDAVDGIDGNGEELINDSLRLDGLDTTFDPDDPRAPAGVFTIDATFSNVAPDSFFDVFFEVTELTGGNTVLSDNGEPPQVDPDDTFIQTFEIGLQEASPFRFFVDAFGTPSGVGGGGGAGAGPGIEFYIGTVTIEKQTDPDGAPGTFNFTGDAVLAGAAPIGDGDQLVNLVGAGSYAATESLPSGFALTGVACDDGASTTPSTGDTGTRTATFNLDLDEAVTCTFTNGVTLSGVPGDVNCDETTNAIDAALILQLTAALLASLACQENGDLTADGTVNAVDAAVVLQCVADLFDCGGPASGRSRLSGVW